MKTGFAHLRVLALALGLLAQACGSSGGSSSGSSGGSSTTGTTSSTTSGSSTTSSTTTSSSSTTSSTTSSGSSGSTGSTTTSSGSSGSSGSAPGAFTLVSPANGSSRQPLTPTLQWNASNGADSYDVEVSDSSSFSTDVFSQSGVTTTSLDVPSSANLAPGVIYFWRVTAVNAAGNTVDSDAPAHFSSPYVVLGAHGIGVTPNGATLVVASDQNNGPIDLITLATGNIQAISTGVSSQPKGIAVSSDGTLALATLLTNGSNGLNGVAIVDLTSSSLGGTITDPCVATTLGDIAFIGSTHQAAMPDLSSGCTQMGLSIFTADTAGPNFSFINFNDTNNPNGVAVTPDGSTAVVSMQLDQKVYEVGISSSAVSNVSVGSTSAGVAITPDGTKAVVANDTGVTVIDLSSSALTPISFTSISDTPNASWHNVAITPDGSTAVVVGTSNLVLVSLASQTLTTYPLSNGDSVAIAPNGTRAYVTDPGDGWVRVVQIP